MTARPLVAVEARLAEPRRGMGRSIDGYAEGPIEMAEFEPCIGGVRRRIQGWEARIQAVREETTSRTTPSLVIGRPEDFAERLHDRRAEIDRSARREPIRLLVERVEIDREDVDVVSRIDPAPPPPDPGASGQGDVLQDHGGRERAPPR